MIGTGSTVVLKAFPGYLRAYQGKVGTVASPVGGKNDGLVVDVAFDGAEAPVPVPLAYLADAPTQKKTRRAALRLTGPKDPRNEAKRLSDGEAEITKPELGYVVWRVGQGRASAICHRCSRKRRERGGRPFVPMECADCREENVRSYGYAPSTNSTPGVPDTFIYHPTRWPSCVVLPCEWKDGPNGERTDEQTDLETEGRIVVVWDTQTLFEAVHRFECADPRIEPHPLLAAWLEKGIK